eukprot:1138386-Pelagomonas_calceolata.AAC.1
MEKKVPTPSDRGPLGMLTQHTSYGSLMKTKDDSPPTSRLGHLQLQLCIKPNGHGPTNTILAFLGVFFASGFKPFRRLITWSWSLAFKLPLPMPLWDIAMSFKDQVGHV